MLKRSSGARRTFQRCSPDPLDALAVPAKRLSKQVVLESFPAVFSRLFSGTFSSHWQRPAVAP
jgi:hypothetical protein